jgi:pimeloyl-ACP methyl ester carboxylesterase
VTDYPDRAAEDDDDIELGLLEVREFEEPGRTRRVLLDTNRGTIECRYHAPEDGHIAVLWVFGSGGGLGVAALSSQLTGTDSVSLVAPRPLLLVHGLSDRVVSPQSSRRIMEEASEPKQLLEYPGCDHGLDHCREALDEDLLGWLRDIVHGGAVRGP